MKGDALNLGRPRFCHFARAFRKKLSENLFHDTSLKKRGKHQKSASLCKDPSVGKVGMMLYQQTPNSWQEKTRPNTYPHQKTIGATTPTSHTNHMDIL